MAELSLPVKVEIAVDEAKTIKNEEKQTKYLGNISLELGKLLKSIISVEALYRIISVAVDPLVKVLNLILTVVGLILRAFLMPLLPPLLLMLYLLTPVLRLAWMFMGPVLKAQLQALKDLRTKASGKAKGGFFEMLAGGLYDLIMVMLPAMQQQVSSAIMVSSFEQQNVKQMWEKFGRMLDNAVGVLADFIANTNEEAISQFFSKVAELTNTIINVISNIDTKSVKNLFTQVGNTVNKFKDEFLPAVDDLIEKFVGEGGLKEYADKLISAFKNFAKGILKIGSSMVRALNRALHSIEKAAKSVGVDLSLPTLSNPFKSALNELKAPRSTSSYVVVVNQNPLFNHLMERTTKTSNARVFEDYLRFGFGLGGVLRK